MKVSSRVLSLRTSGTSLFSVKASQMRREGIPVVNLGVGEPDFDTPEHIKSAAKQAMDQGCTKYAPLGGLPALRSAIAEKLQCENALHYAPTQVVVTVGVKQALLHLFFCLLNPGDEVLLPTPCWMSYAEMPQLAQAVVVPLPCSHKNGFRLSAEQLAAAMTPRTKLFLLNSPSNPSGVVYDRTELASFAAVLRQHPQVICICDDIYEHILYTEAPFVTLLNVAPDLIDRTVIVNGFSKAYAMTGWRVGYAAGPVPLMRAMETLQSQSVTAVGTIDQYAALAALTGPQDARIHMRSVFYQRSLLVHRTLSACEGVSVFAAQGAFYVLVHIQSLLSKLVAARRISEPTDVSFCQHFLEKYHVVVVPGSVFFDEGSFRLSFAASDEELSAFFQRFQEMIAI